VRVGVGSGNPVKRRAVEQALDATGVATRGGAVGALTDGRVGRADALAAAVSCALAPIVVLTARRFVGRTETRAKPVVCGLLIRENRPTQRC
jgi:non-canonical (house-cleaning) NTP pyrophosphatase